MNNEFKLQANTDPNTRWHHLDVDGQKLDQSVQIALSERGWGILVELAYQLNVSPSNVVEQLINREAYLQIQSDPDGQMTKEIELTIRTPPPVTPANE